VSFGRKLPQKTERPQVSRGTRAFRLAGSVMLCMLRGNEADAVMG
jgi:hypothetical protein